MTTMDELQRLHRQFPDAIPSDQSHHLWTPKVLVCHEKHGEWYWDATTPTQFRRSALAILRARWSDGYWYPDPTDDGLGKGEWADKRREEIRKANAMTKEQIEALPSDAAKAIIRLRREDKQSRDWDARYSAWYERAKAVLKDGAPDLVQVGTKTPRMVSVAWGLLDERSDAEYEHVSLETMTRDDDS